MALSSQQRPKGLDEAWRLEVIKMVMRYAHTNVAEIIAYDRQATWGKSGGDRYRQEEERLSIRTCPTLRLPLVRGRSCVQSTPAAPQDQCLSAIDVCGDFTRQTRQHRTLRSLFTIISCHSFATLSGTVTSFASLLGVKRTCRFALHMSANDPKRTSRLHLRGGERGNSASKQ